MKVFALGRENLHQRSTGIHDENRLPGIDCQIPVVAAAARIEYEQGMSIRIKFFHRRFIPRVADEDIPCNISGNGLRILELSRVCARCSPCPEILDGRQRRFLRSMLRPRAAGAGKHAAE